MKKIFLTGLPLAFLVGCTSSNPSFPPEVVAYRTPVDAHSGIRHQNHRSATRGYTKRSVVEPEPWKKQNAAPSSWTDQNVDPVAAEEPSS